MKNLTSGAEFHDFDLQAVFIGRLVGQQLREKDGKSEDQKAGTVIGYSFVDADGETHLIGNSHAIKKAVDQVSLGEIMRFEFRGKSQNAMGQPVKRFKIDVLEPGDEGYFENPKVDKGEQPKESGKKKKSENLPASE